MDELKIAFLLIKSLTVRIYHIISLIGLSGPGQGRVIAPVMGRSSRSTFGLGVKTLQVSLGTTFTTAQTAQCLLRYNERDRDVSQEES